MKSGMSMNVGMEQRLELALRLRMEKLPILVIEDNYVELDLTKKKLEEKGYLVQGILGRNSDNAISELEKACKSGMGNILAAIVDGLNGKGDKAIKLIREKNPDLPCAIYTAYVSPLERPVDYGIFEKSREFDALEKYIRDKLMKSLSNSSSAMPK